MLLIFVTFAVLNLVTSSEVRDEQPQNILIIFVTISVLNLVTSSEVSSEQPENIKLISVTFSVFRYFRPVIVSSFVSSLKKPFNDVGVYVLKLLSKTMCTIVPFPIFLLIAATVILSSTQALLLGRLSPSYFSKVKVLVSESYVAMYLELEAAFCATMRAGRNNNMSNIIGKNRANLRSMALPIKEWPRCDPLD